MSQNCRDCRWAEWERTKTGRIAPSRPGRCVYPYERIKLPKAEQSRYIGQGFRSALWRSSPYDNCPTWEADAQISRQDTDA